MGVFLISNVPEGKWSIEVWGQGWITHREVISLKAGMPKSMEIKLPQNKVLDPVPMAVTKSQQSKILEQVLQAFIGPDFKNRGVTLLNPDKLKFEQHGDNSLRVYSQGAIFFSNGESGYLVSVYFSPFVLGSGEEIQASYSYFELPAEESELSLRRQKRMEIYNQSPQKFISQLMTGSLEGFDKNPNPEVSFAESSGDYYLRFAKPLLVKLPDGNQGTLDYRGDRLEVKLNGAPVMKEELLLTGGLLSGNPIFSLPSNFNADKLIKLANLEKTAETMQERIFIHTDRKHYWPGENLYFKAYFNYVNPLLSAELSEVLHMELLDSTGNPLLHRVFNIQEGFSSGYLQLPDLGASENLLLRAYTAWGQNYSNGDFFLPIQVLSPMDQPEPIKPQSEALGVGVFSDKQTYQGGEQVKLNIMAFDASGNPVNANLSVSVLDLNQAVALPDRQPMTESFRSKTAWSNIENFYGQPEKDFSLQGQLLDRAGAVSYTHLTLPTNREV